MTSTTSADQAVTAPAVEYQQRSREQQTRAAALQRRHVVLGYVRLVLGLIIVVLLWPAVHRPGVFWLWVLLPTVLFGIAARMHGRVLAELTRTRQVLAFYEHAIARVEDRWAGVQPRETRLDPSSSLYAADLDLFGPGSLFELLCEARTTLGEDRLAAWLLEPAPVAEVLERQQAIIDLRSRLALREAWASIPGPPVARLDARSFESWVAMPARVLPAAVAWIAPLLLVLTLAAVWRYAAAHTPLLLLLVLIINASLTYFLKARYLPLFAEAQHVSEAMETSGALLRCVESAEFQSPLLRRLQGQLRSGHRPAPGALEKLAALSQWIDARGNYVVRLLDIPLLYSLQVALAVQRWRAEYSQQFLPWLGALAEFEALLSLAGFSYEHPEDTLPEFLDGSPRYEAEALGHPLLPAASCVRNDIAFGGETQLVIVSGSNMSGKSTLMRSVGVNAVLAFAGAPVRASLLRMTPVRVVASIQVQDSLQQGRSRFFAEILRLRAITEAAHTQGPVLFLLDELLAGTNSHDRLVGAQGLVRDLLSTSAVGLLSTHDLALTHIADEDRSAQSVRNVHFEDLIVDGNLRFDYKLREGVVERSNGIALMRLIGLKV